MTAPLDPATAGPVNIPESTPLVGGIARYDDTPSAIRFHTGAAVSPPYIPFFGSSITTEMQCSGASAGKNPMNDTKCFEFEYRPSMIFCAVPVLPATS